MRKKDIGHMPSCKMIIFGRSNIFWNDDDVEFCCRSFPSYELETFPIIAIVRKDNRLGGL